jgi:hypothetical protein
MKARESIDIMSAPDSEHWAGVVRGATLSGVETAL